MQHKKNKYSLFKYIVLLGLTLLSVFVVCFSSNKTITMEEQKQKYLSDKAKENYINLIKAETQYASSTINLEYLSDYQVDMSWEQNPGIFYVQVFDNGFEWSPSLHLQEMAAIPQDVNSVTMEFFATGTYNDSLDIGLSQYDDASRIDYQSNRVNMPFSLANYKGEQHVNMYSLDFNIHPNAKYFKIQIRVFGYFKDAHVYLGYFDMNWK